MDRQRLLELAGALEENIPTHSKQYAHLARAKQALSQFGQSQDPSDVANAVSDLIEYIEEVMEGHL